MFGGRLDQEVSKKECKIRVSWDIRNSLWRGVRVSVDEGQSQGIRFLYEDLRVFCFGCGKLGHGLDDYEEVSMEQKRKPECEQPYSPALRAGSDFVGPTPGETLGHSIFLKQKNYFGDLKRQSSHDQGTAAKSRVGEGKTGQQASSHARVEDDDFNAEEEIPEVVEETQLALVPTGGDCTGRVSGEKDLLLDSGQNSHQPNSEVAMDKEDHVDVEMESIGLQPPSCNALVPLSESEEKSKSHMALTSMPMQVDSDPFGLNTTIANLAN